MKLAKKVLLVYALMVLIAGIYAYATKKTLPSLLGGVFGGALLFYSRWLLSQKPLFGFILGIVLSLALLGQFVRGAMARSLTPITSALIFFSVVTAVILIASLLQERKSSAGGSDASVEEKPPAASIDKVEAEEETSSEDS